MVGVWLRCESSHTLTTTGFYESHVYQSDLIKFYHNRGISVQARSQHRYTHLATTLQRDRETHDSMFLHPLDSSGTTEGMVRAQARRRPTDASWFECARLA